MNSEKLKLIWFFVRFALSLRQSFLLQDRHQSHEERTGPEEKEFIAYDVLLKLLRNII
jgi:hypothetical protein